MAIRPDLVDMSLIDRRHEPGSGGRLALGEDAGEANPEYGRMINEAIIAAMGTAAAAMARSPAAAIPPASLGYKVMEQLWAPIYAGLASWTSVSPWPGQPEVPQNSRWHDYVRPAEALRPAR
jgi:hypothetical protein